MESEIRGEFQCVARFVLGKPFSEIVEEDGGGMGVGVGDSAGIEVDDELDKPSKAGKSLRVLFISF